MGRDLLRFVELSHGSLFSLSTLLKKSGFYAHFADKFLESLESSRGCYIRIFILPASHVYFYYSNNYFSNIAFEQWPRIRFASNVRYFIFIGYLFDRTTIISDKLFAIVEETMEVCLTRQMHLAVHQRTHLRLCFSFVQSSKRR